jgi:hypothetical protein
VGQPLDHAPRDPFDGAARRIMHRTQIKGTTGPVAFAA